MSGIVPGSSINSQFRSARAYDAVSDRPNQISKRKRRRRTGKIIAEAQKMKGYGNPIMDYRASNGKQ